MILPLLYLCLIIGVHVFRMQRNKSLEGPSSPWAVKCLSKKAKITEMAITFEQRLEEEAQFLRKLSHPNIVGFRAFKKSVDGRECLAMEECSGSLGDLLETRFEEGEGALPVNFMNKVCAIYY